MKRFIDWLHPVPVDISPIIDTPQISEASPSPEVCPHRETRMWDERGEELVRRCKKCGEIV